MFDGIDDAISLFQGALSIIWDFPHYVNGDIVDLESVRYHILSYAGTFDFKSVLENSNHTAETLISEFEVNSVNETSGIQYHLVDDGEVFKFDLNTTFYGKAHALLVIAEVDGVLSRNANGIEVYASEVDPVVKEDVNIVGIFVPTDRLEVRVSEDNTMLEFDGPVRQEHKDLVAGDYVYGISSSPNEEFFLLVTSVIESSDQRVVLSTEVPKLEDVFDEIDFELAVAMSRPEKVETSPSSRHKHRHLIQARQSRLRERRLNWFLDGLQFIGDAVSGAFTGAFEAGKDLWNVVTNGEVEKSFELIDIREEMTFEVKPSHKNSTFEVSSEIGKMELKIDVRSDIYVSMKVSFDQVKAEAGWRATYSTNFDLALYGDSELTLKKTLKEWPKQNHKFMVVVVPVWLDVQFKLDGKFSVKTSSDVGAAAKLSIGKCWRVLQLHLISASCFILHFLLQSN